MHNTSFSLSPGQAVVAVVGLGKIGLPLAVQYARHGRRVIGCDANPQVVETINAGKVHIQEETGLAESVADLVARGLLSATSDTGAATREAGIIVVIVPVIIDAQHEPDFTPLDEATRAIGAGLQPGTLIIYETTVPVGTTTCRTTPLLEQTSQLKAGQDFYVAFSPERVSSSHIFRDLHSYPKIVGGMNEQTTAMAAAFYRSVLDASIMMMASNEEAEFVKLIETTYRDVNIALANEFAHYADVHGLNISRAIEAANTQPYSHIHTPGVGVGGHCIPVYPYFLFAGAKNRQNQIHDSEMPMLLLPHFARRINDAMAEYAIHRIETIVGPLVGQSVLILGVAYRGDVREVAFTSAKLLQNALIKHEAMVYVDDPLFSAEELRSLGYTPLAPEMRGEIHAVILQADHQAYRSFDVSRFTRCQVLLDGRGTFDREKIEAAGIRYIRIGDGSRGQFDQGDSDGQTVLPSMVWNGGKQ
jgi:nucleotide sugar dehydrogenase